MEMKKNYITYPLSRFPQGGMAKEPSPLGEGQDGGL